MDDAGGRDPYERAARRRATRPACRRGCSTRRSRSRSTTRRARPGRPKGVVYTYRGAYLNALGEVIEAELGHHPVYLWTLPMFHCNGWCFPWAVTAAGGTHVCLRRVDPADGLAAAPRARASRTTTARPTVQIALVNHPDAGAAGAPRDRDRRRRAAVADAARPDGGAEHPRRARLRADRDLRPAHGAARWQDDWDELPVEERARLLARQGQAYTTADPVRVVDEEMRDVPRDGAHAWARS